MNPDELCVTASEIRILVAIITKLAKHDLEHRLAAAGAGISELQLGVMRLLQHDGCTIKELSGKMMLSPATLVPVIDALERQGLATRGRDPKDRRRTPLALTEHGVSVIAGLPFIDRDDALFQSLLRMGDQKSQQLLALLREMATIMSNDGALVAKLSTEIRSLMRPSPEPSDDEHDL